MSEALGQRENTWLARWGESAAVALAIALVGSLPATLRSVSLDGAVASVAVLLWLLLPLACMREAASRGWRGVVGPEAPRALGVRLALWIGVGVALVALLGSVLKATTNHRGLGGWAFGLGATVMVAGAAVLAWRLTAIGLALRERGVSATPLAGLALLVSIGPALFVALPLVRGAGEGSAAATRGAVFDLLLVMAAAALLLPRQVPAVLQRAARLVALPLCVFIVVLGGYRVETSHSAAAALRDTGGVAAAVMGALELWSDTDADGHGAYFGGHDCDEGDPKRNPAAQEIPGDGIDSDCDGLDGPLALAEQAPAPAVIPTAAATASAAASHEGAAPAAAAIEKPDIILVTLDTVRADHTSAYGYAKKTTPALAELAARGMLFEHAYGVATDTQRALMPVYSGRTLSKTPRTKTKWPSVLDDADTVAERLRRAGYGTAAVVSFTWLRKDRGFHQGFDVLDESPFRNSHPERKSTGAGVTKAVGKRYATLAKGDAPLFLWVHLFDAHESYLHHDGFDFGGGHVGRYDSEVAFVDQQIAALVKMVADAKRMPRTLWLVHGSHGEAFGEHGKRGHGSELYDEQLRVPLVVAGPGVAAGRYGSDAVSVLDVAPTLLDFAGAEGSGVDGVSLRAACEGKDLSRAPILAHAWRRTAVIDWPIKLIVIRRGGKKERLLLFDLAADPQEKRDVSGDRPDDLLRLNELRKDT